MLSSNICQYIHDTDIHPYQEYNLSLYDIDSDIHNDINNDIDNDIEIITSFINHDINMINGFTLQQKLFTLSICNCCLRHQTNKPILFKSYYFPFNYKKNYFSHYYSCKCKCRHFSRLICNIYL